MSLWFHRDINWPHRPGGTVRRRSWFGRAIGWLTRGRL